LSEGKYLKHKKAYNLIIGFFIIQHVHRMYPGVDNYKLTR